MASTKKRKARISTGRTFSAGGSLRAGRSEIPRLPPCKQRKRRKNTEKDQQDLYDDGANKDRWEQSAEAGLLRLRSMHQFNRACLHRSPSLA